MLSEQQNYQGTELLKFSETSLRNYNNAIVGEILTAAPASARTLDFGAGVGSLTRLVRSRGRSVDCVELDVRHRAELETQGMLCYARISDVPSASYDYVYSSNVLEHIEDDIEALKEVRRVLRPGGTLLLYVPAFNVLYTELDRLVGHHRRYTASVLRDRLERSGFTVQQLKYSDFLGFFVTYAFKVLSNNMGDVNPRTTQIYDAIIVPINRLIERFVRVPLGKNVYAFARRAE